MRKLIEIIPDPNDLLSLEPEEVGGVILQVLTPAKHDKHHLGNFLNGPMIAEYPRAFQDAISLALNEGWSWLKSEGLLVEDHTQNNNGWVVVTRRGQRLMDSHGFAEYRSSAALRKELLHPRIAERVWSSFLRGDFDNAVFAAFKEVEVCVRELSKESPEIIGDKLMRTAFGSDGPLTDKNLPEAEQKSLANLFAGAIGWFKNPQSHRHVGFTQARHTAQALVFASHLISLAELQSIT